MRKRAWRMKRRGTSGRSTPAGRFEVGLEEGKRKCGGDDRIRAAPISVTRSHRPAVSCRGESPIGAVLTPGRRPRGPLQPQPLAQLRQKSSKASIVRGSIMKKALLAGVAALLMATSAAHALPDGSICAVVNLNVGATIETIEEASPAE